jgi:hypothetical protein
VPEAPAHKERKQPVTGARPLSPDEKASIRKDWESFPKMLRTAENRRALASKYRCSNQQVFALVREDGHLLLLARKAAEKKHAESLTGAATR